MGNASDEVEEMEVEEANARGSVKEQKDRLLKMVIFCMIDRTNRVDYFMKV